MKKIRIGLIGYGRMGQMIEQLAPDQQAEVIWKITSANRAMLDTDLLTTVDVVIEMTRPDAALQNVLLCISHGTPVVTGTTGWQTELPLAYQACQAKGGSMLYASNFSVGVNLFFAFNRFVAERMSSLGMYTPEVHEWHHVHKKDAPSGTAVSIAEGIMQGNEQYTAWALANDGAAVNDDTACIPIHAYREGEIVGTHSVLWKSAVDEIGLTHKAYRREGFALGALMAARYIHDKTGVCTMQEVIFGQGTI